MSTEIETLRSLSHELDRPESIEALMQLAVDGAALLLGVPRCSAWLLDPTRTRLLVGARAGMPLHRTQFEYQLGQGLLGWIAEKVQPLRTGDAEADPRFLPRAGMLERMGSFLGVPLVAHRACIGVLSAVSPEVDYFSKHHEDLLVVLGSLFAARLEVARLERLAVLDEATGTFNRQGLSVAYARAAERLASREAVSVLAVRMEGAAQGAGSLRRVADLLRALVRSDATVVRYEEDCFVLVVPGAGPGEAAALAERIREAVASAELSISLGAATREPHDSWNDTISRALGAR